MPRKYSNKTLDELARFIDRCFTGTEITSLFLCASVPKDLGYGANKLARVLNVIITLKDADDIESTKMLDELFDEVVARRWNLFQLEDEAVGSLTRALRADSYEIRKGKIVSLDTLETELAQEMSVLQERLEAFGMHDVHNNLEQAHQNFVDAHFEACNAMLRTAFESTLKHTAKHLAGDLNNVPRANPKYLSPSDIRNYLLQQNFFSDDEIKFIKEFYGYTSTDGSHPGISSEPDSRLRRLMIVATIQYCLEKLTLWPRHK